MARSQKSIIDIAITKGGTLANPSTYSKSFNQLKQVLDSMYTNRSGANITCTGHSGTSYTGRKSLKEMETAVNTLKGCTCNSRTGSGCTCQAATLCSCNSRDSGCDCNAQHVVGAASYCNCMARATDTDSGYYGNCTCFCRIQVANGASCICQQRSGVPSGQDNGSDETGPICPNRGSLITNCNTVYSVYNNVGPCVNRTGASLCASRTGCTCNSVCTCNTVKEFS